VQAKELEVDVVTEPRKILFPLRKWKTDDNVEQKLMNLKYRKTSANNWTNGRKVVHITRSSKFERRIRIMWREEWKDFHAIIYDYSNAQGPVCVIPVSILFNSAFVKEKRNSDAYANSGYWWSQSFPRGHELAKLILSFQDRWDILDAHI